MGKGQSPTPAELKFIYSLFSEGYSDADVLKRYEELERHSKLGSLPFRYDIRFIRQRRKEYEAAKEILKSKIGQQAAPTLAQAKEQHFAEIRDLIENLYKVTRTPYPLEIVLPIDSFERDEVGDLTDDYGLIGALELLESTPLFDCVKEHIPSDDIWHKFSQWKDHIQLYIDTCRRLVNQFVADDGVNDFITQHPNERKIYFYRPLLRFITEKALGREPEVFSKQLPEEPKSLTQLKLKAAAPYRIFDTRDLDLVKPELYGRFLNSDVARNIIDLFQQLKVLEEGFRIQLQDAYLSRSHITTTCRLCPG